MDQTRFTEAEVAEFQEAFDLFDKDQDGKIDLNQMDKVTRACGQVYNEKILQDMFNERDPEETGFIDFNDFMYLMVENAEEKNIFNELVSAFQVFDPDGNTFIKASDMAEILTKYGDKLSEDEVKLFIKEADKQKEGLIFYEKYSEVIAKALFVKEKKKTKKVVEPIKDDEEHEDDDDDT